MNRTQLIRHNAKLPGGKKPPRAKDYERADDVFRPADLNACDRCPKEVAPHHCEGCRKIQHD
jgi:hypothetical protein